VEHAARESVQKHASLILTTANIARAEWAKLDHVITVIAAAVRQWRRYLSSCVRAAVGGRFEHCFQF